MRASPPILVALALAASILSGVRAVRPSSEEELQVDVTASAMAAMSIEMSNDMNISTQSPFKGNFMYMTVGHTLDWEKHRDGRLDATGLQQVRDRLEFLKGSSPSTLEKLGSVDEVWVAPTRGAFETAILAVGLARKLQEDSKWSSSQSIAKFPSIVLKGFLRGMGPMAPTQKIKDYDLKWPTMGRDVAAAARERSAELFDGDEKMFEPIAVSFMTMFNTFRHPAPSCADHVFQNLHNLKVELYKARAKKVLIISDREIANYLFMSYLPYVPEKEYQVVVPEELMRTLVRERVQSLTEAAVVTAVWQSDPHTTGCDMAPGISNFCYTVPYLQQVEFSDTDLDVSEASPTLRTLPLDESSQIVREVEGTFAPRGAEWSRFDFKKRKKLASKPIERWSKWQERLWGVSHWQSELQQDTHIGFVSWATPFGNEARGFVASSDVSFGSARAVAGGQKGLSILPMSSKQGDLWELQGHQSMLHEFQQEVWKSQGR
eukprot:CAMPEP_0178383718 /NCGR_PEP_ID=MMETSP0689_2-20121128/7143_1 /TAXON_ID=160604 /ORGANISM="Amphidinium massartii, Strain CS-259" /LENGTH=489 /DNA_ID=CAMNT_0020003941 /DNA_START=43 /DNA_END=1509 /DNA_ORIENTATION=+